MDGVTFSLARPDGTTLQTDTGDSIPGAVYFGGPEAGTYTLTESIPEGITSAFVWDCTGMSGGGVHPTPLVTGNVLTLALGSGDAVTCDWFNVAAPVEPDTGSLTLYKYLCSTATYVSEVDCELYEWHATFDLRAWNGTAFESIDTATTDSVGVIGWDGLAPGSYSLREHGSEPCRVATTIQDGAGHIRVAEGEETIVTVYNCTAPGETPAPGRPPVKYPNTGVPAAGTPSIPGSPEPSAAGEPGAIPSSSADQGICPVVSEPNGIDPSVRPSTSPADQSADDSCDRGQVPVRIAIEEIQVDAEVEMLEVIAGEMQPPTTSDVTSWYRETARLGEQGNVVIAGHLNYWDDPEGVFHDIADLAVGDVVTVTGVDGGVYRYEVTDVELVPVDSDVSEEVGPGDGETLTLITCGGEWDASSSQYDARTIVHAKRIA
jgi:LPXTG-site transpeptidase (sortase) family protein